MFKSRNRPRPIFSKRRTNRNPLPLVGILMMIPVALISLELLSRIALNLSSGQEKLKNQTQEPPIVNSYRLKFVNESQQPYQTLAKGGELVAQRTLTVGYQLLGDRSNKNWYINAQGFRDRLPISEQKPSNEVRIFILGGSAAFGQGNASNDETISAFLENLLRDRIDLQKRSPDKYRPEVLPLDAIERAEVINKPAKIKSGNYRVINAAVPGYASGNELAQLAVNILPYKPDLIVVIDGYADLMQPSEQKLTQIPKVEKLVDRPSEYFQAYLAQSFKPLINASAFATIAQAWLSPSLPLVAQTSIPVTEESKSIEQYLPESQEELQRRVNKYFDNHRQIARLCAGARIPLIVGVQPEITGNSVSQLSQGEKEILVDLGREYIKRTKKDYPQFLQSSQLLAKYLPKNVTTLNLYNFPTKDTNTKAIFADAIHLTKEANHLIAIQLYTTIASLPKIQVSAPIPTSTTQPVKTSPKVLSPNPQLPTSKLQTKV